MFATDGMEIQKGQKLLATFTKVTSNATENQMQLKIKCTNWDNVKIRQESTMTEDKLCVDLVY